MKGKLCYNCPIRRRRKKKKIQGSKKHKAGVNTEEALANREITRGNRK